MANISVSDHLNSDYVWRIPANQPIQIEEKSAGGEGIVEFFSNKDAIVIKSSSGTHTIWALKKKKCAEGAIITTAADGYHLHILEMKSKLTQGEWKKALEQLTGMFLAAHAVARIMDISGFSSTTCYIAYGEDAMGAEESADLIFMKTLVGSAKPIGGLSEWLTETVALPLSTTASILKAKRDEHHNASFGLI